MSLFYSLKCNLYTNSTSSHFVPSILKLHRHLTEPTINCLYCTRICLSLPSYLLMSAQRENREWCYQRAHYHLINHIINDTLSTCQNPNSESDYRYSISNAQCNYTITWAEQQLMYLLVRAWWWTALWLVLCSWPSSHRGTPAGLLWSVVH